MLGNRIEGSSPPQTEIVRNCGTQTFYEPRTVAYDVVYEYAGRQYRTQMAQDPGRYVRLNVTPMDAMPPPPAVYPSRPQVRYETPPPPVVYGGYPSGYSNISTEVVIIGGQRYHRPPGWRGHPGPGYYPGHGHPHYDRNR